jgi:hypothetical protein
VGTVFVSLTVCVFLDIGSDLIFYVSELVVLCNELYCLSNSRVTMYWVVVVLLNDLFLEFFWNIYSNLYYKVVDYVRGT